MSVLPNCLDADCASDNSKVGATDNSNGGYQEAHGRFEILTGLQTTSPTVMFRDNVIDS